VWKGGGGGTVWDAITYDPKTDCCSLASATWAVAGRDSRPGGKGDHLFCRRSSRLKPDTGEYVGTTREVQRDSWDDIEPVQQMHGDGGTVNGAEVPLIGRLSI